MIQKKQKQNKINKLKIVCVNKRKNKKALS